LNGFLEGYYRTAAPWIKKYLSEMQQALQSSTGPLWIYSSPVQETSSFLGPDHMVNYAGYFNEAETAAGKDTTVRSRLLKAKLPLQYAEIEIARKEITGPSGFLEKRGGQWSIKHDFLVSLDNFAYLADLYQVKSIHEDGLKPQDYKMNVLNSLTGAFTEHPAMGKPYTLTYPPSPKYMADGTGSLTDGKHGFENYHVLWQGFEGEDFEMVIDLGDTIRVGYFSAGFLQDIASWIFWPLSVNFLVSADGMNYNQPEGARSAETNRGPVKLVESKFDPVLARYVRVYAKSMITCPDWHIGHGGKAWIFVDEIVVK
jgi:hypothetical protein